MMEQIRINKLPILSRFAVGVVTDVSIPKRNGDEDEEKSSYKTNTEATRGMVRVDFSIGNNIRVRTTWLPYLKRWTFAAGKEDNKYITAGSSSVPQIGTRVLVAFAQHSYNAGVVLGCIPDKFSKPIFYEYDEFKTSDFAYTDKTLGFGFISNGKAQDSEAKVKKYKENGERFFIFKNDKESKKKPDENPYYLSFNFGEEDSNTSNMIIVCNTFNLQVDGKLNINSEDK